MFATNRSFVPMSRIVNRIGKAAGGRKSRSKQQCRRFGSVEQLERREMMAADLGTHHPLPQSPIASNVIEPIAVVASANVPVISNTLDNSFATARDLGVISGTRTFNDFVGPADTNDYYKFTVAQGAQLSLVLDQLSADIELFLYDSNRQLIVGSENGGNSSEQVQVGIGAGTYYVRVAPYLSNQSNYRLSLNVTPNQPSDGAGNSFATARDLGVVNGTRTFNDFVGPSDTNDYYKFTVAQNGQLSLILDQLSADIELYLYDSNNQLIASSTNSGSSSELLQRAIPAGTYYVRVALYLSNQSNYRLSLTVTPNSNPVDGAGNTFATARDLGVVNGTRIFNDFVGPSDTNDYYKFTVAQNGQLSLILDQLSADIQLYLYDSNGQLITSSLNGGNNSELLHRAIPAGTYYVRVAPYLSNQSNYRLSLTVTPNPVFDGAGNTFATARDLGVVNGTRTFNDFVGPSDTNDYYKFTVAQNGQLSLILDQLSADIELFLYDSNNQLIASSTNSGSSSELLQRAIPAGTYYVRVAPYLSNQSNYRLSLTVTPNSNPVDGAGNTFETARDLGVFSGTRTFQDFVGPSDTRDYYKFTVAQGAQLSVLLDQLSGNIDLHLYNSNRQLMNSSTRDGNSSEQLQLTLPAGTYYVLVAPYFSAQSNYRLSLTVTSNPVSDGAGNTFDTARDLGVVSGTRTFNDFVGPSDTNDYYKFTVAQRSQVSVLLDQLSGNIDLHLYNSNRQLMASSLNNGSSSEQIQGTLPAGTYYLRVTPYFSAQSNYRLSLTVTRNIIASDSRGGINAAMAIPVSLNHSGVATTLTTGQITPAIGSASSANRSVTSVSPAAVDATMATVLDRPTSRAATTSTTARFAPAGTTAPQASAARLAVVEAAFESTWGDLAAELAEAVLR